MRKTQQHDDQEVSDEREFRLQTVLVFYLEGLDNVFHRFFQNVTILNV